MFRIKPLMLIFVFPLLTAALLAQGSHSTTISGFVYDKSNGEAMIGATVSIKGGRQGTSTNNSGYFVINNVPPGRVQIQASYIGYKTELVSSTIKQGEALSVKIELAPETVGVKEVVISGEKADLGEKLYAKPVSVVSMTAREVNAIPKAVEADLLRALQTMPGITALSDFSSALYVRGGTPDQNLYLIDGADVYNPEHAFGIFSTFNTYAIKKVDVSKGGFSADYGGRLSSVIDVTNLDGNRNNYEALMNVSLLSGSLTMQVPLGSLGSLSGSFRRTYIDQTYSKWVKDLPSYYFYDGNLKGFIDISDRDKISASYFRSNDNLNYKLNKNTDKSAGFKYEWGNSSGSVNWKHVFSPKLFSSFWVTGSRFNSDFAFEKLIKLSENNSLSDLTFKASLEYYLNDAVTVKFGAEQKFLKFKYKEEWNSGKVDLNQRNSLTTVYGNIQWRPSDDWEVSAGLRGNYFDSDKKYYNPEPRFSAKYRIDENSSVKLSAGMFCQYLNRIPRLFFASIWSSVDEYTKPSRAMHAILGYQKQFGGLLQFETEVFYKDYRDVYIFNQLLGSVIKPGYYTAEGYPVYNSTKGVFTRGDGNSKGVELLLRKETGTITGWVSYTYSKTENTFDGINQGKYYNPRHDRSSVVNLVLNGELGDLFSLNWNDISEKKKSRWICGINFIYATGQPITVPASIYFCNSLPEGYTNYIEGQSISGYKLNPGSINSYRLPDYARLDVSITYEHDYGSWSLAPYLQIINLGGRKNVWFVDYSNELQGNTVVQKIDKVNMLPMLPSIGVTVKF